MTCSTNVGRERRVARRALLALSTISCACAGAVAIAQETKLVSTPADHFAVTPGGVDMRTGRYAYNETDLSIGAEKSALSFTRTMATDAPGHVNPFGNFSHNWDIMLTERRVDLSNPRVSGVDYRISVHFGGRSQTFEARANNLGFSQASKGGPYAKLTSAGDRASGSVVYTFTASDGTTALFRQLGGGDCSSLSGVRCAYVSEITEPDGTKLTFGYASSGGAQGGAVRLQSVRSSRGYALLLEGSGNRVTKACVLSLATRIFPVDGVCPSDAPATASYGYSTTGATRLASVTGPDGAIQRFNYRALSFGTDMDFIKPGQTSPWLTNTIHPRIDEQDIVQDIVMKQVFADGRSYSYSYDETPQVSGGATTLVGGRVLDNLSREITYRYDFPIAPESQCTTLPCPQEKPDDPLVYQQTSGPAEVIDALGRSTTFNYCDPNALATLKTRHRCVVITLQSYTDPEGITTKLKYDNNRNIIEATRYAKNSSGLPVIVTKATYNTDITKPKLADKPLSMTDAMENTTTYTYSPDHGGILTETGPAVNGVQPQTRYIYTPKRAWTWNGSGYSPGSTIWLLTQTSLCKSGPAASSGVGCAKGATDEVITNYDYGPDSGPNTLLLRGTEVIADGQSRRTCHGYDTLGNKVSETKPRASLTSC